MKLVKHRRIKGWKKPDNTRSIMRNTKFGNPWKAEWYGQGNAVQFFRLWLQGKGVSPGGMSKNEASQRREYILDHMDDLGKYDALMCCTDWDGTGDKPQCHGVVYIEMLGKEATNVI